MVSPYVQEARSVSQLPFELQRWAVAWFLIPGSYFACSLFDMYIYQDHQRSATARMPTPLVCVWMGAAREVLSCANSAGEFGYLIAASQNVVLAVPPWTLFADPLYSAAELLFVCYYMFRLVS